MKIIYVRPDRILTEGDVKVLKDGTKFVRYRVCIDGCGVRLGNGDPMYDWRRDPSAPVPTTPQGPRDSKAHSRTFRFDDSPAGQARANAFLSALSGRPFPI
jgi:hypothetical protein